MNGIQHTDRDHALISPSALGRTVECPGWIEFSTHFPKQETSDAAADGTVVHELLDDMFKGEPITREHTEEQLEYALSAHTWWQTLEGKFTKFESWSEIKVKLTDNIWGTLDRGLYDRESSTLIVWDYKHGQGVEVFAHENWQLMAYAIGLMRKLGLGKELKRVWCVVYQPRIKLLNKFDVWETDVETLIDRFKTMRATEDKVVKKVQEFKSGMHCTFCPCKSDCKTLLEDTNKALVTQMDDEVLNLPLVDKITLDQKINIFKHKPQIEKFLKNIATSLLNQAVAGEKLEGLKVVEGDSKRKWIKEEAIIEKELKSLDVEPYEKKLRAFSKVEKELGKDKNKISHLLVKPKGKLTLVEESSKRKAVDLLEDNGFTEIKID